jgi:hypothetical protein
LLPKTRLSARLAVAEEVVVVVVAAAEVAEEATKVEELDLEPTLGVGHGRIPHRPPGRPTLRWLKPRPTTVVPTTTCGLYTP